MRAYDYGSHQEPQLDEVWAGLRKYLVGIVPKADRDAAGGEQEMAKWVGKHIAAVMQLAGRYKDDDGKPIKLDSLYQLPTKAIYYYMRAKMQLPDQEIVGILRSISTNKQLLGANVKTPRNLTPAQLNTDGNTIERVWQVMDAKTAEMILDKLIGIAAIRQMEINEFGPGATGDTQQPAVIPRAGTPVANMAGYVYTGQQSANGKPTVKPAAGAAGSAAPQAAQASTAAGIATPVSGITAPVSDIDAALAALTALGARS